MDVDVFAGVSVILLAKVMFLCIGSVELVKAVADQDWRKAAVIMTSALVGLLAGSTLEGIDGATGLLIGLSASGAITTVQNVGHKV